MQIDEIQKFLDTKTSAGHEYVKITFKKRDAVYGLFVRDHQDYTDLKAKNFWRVVPQSQFGAWEETHNVSLAKIFLGSDFSRLALSKEH